VQDDPDYDIWADTTTLYITLYNGDSARGPVVGKGILRLTPVDLMHELSTFQVLNARNELQRLKACAQFGEFFAGQLFQTYGGIFSKPTAFDPNAPPGKKRPLRVDAPTVHFFNTSDGLRLRLTRYKGGNKGPVMLWHGLGVSSSIFSTDTIDTNLLEYLFANGYDVWLVDFRASIELPASNTQYSVDDVATKDYPAAVAKVRELTGAPSVQMVVHCFGSSTFFAAMLAGLQWVRSAVCSQIATNYIVPPLTRAKAGLHLPQFLELLGVKSLSAYSDTHEDWKERLYDKALKLYPVPIDEYCNNPVCHRITFMYALLYEHAELDEATHAGLHEMFGIASMKAFEHLALLARVGHLVDAKGGNTYMPNVKRLAIPISFIHGGNNACFLPASTEATFKLLSETNGPDLYTRHVIPGYGHIDCIFGKNAAQDVYPFILHHLEGPGA
jgi:cholesterol oxidase